MISGAAAAVGLVAGAGGRSRDRSRIRSRILRNRNGFRLRPRGGPRTVYLREQTRELQFPEKLGEADAVGLGALKVLYIPAESHILAQTDQFARDLDRVAARRDGLTLLAFDLSHVFEHAVERAILVDKIGCCLGPDARDTGHVVHAVAH